MSETQAKTPVRVTVELSLRNAQGVAISSNTVKLDIPESMLPIHASCEQLILIQPASAKGSYSVYAGSKSGAVSHLIGSFWSKVGDRASRFDVKNLSIVAHRAEKGAPITPMMNKTTGTAVYQYDMVNTHVGFTMPNAILSLKSFIQTSIDASKLCPERASDIAEITVGVVDEVSVISVAPVEIQNPLVAQTVVG